MRTGGWQRFSIMEHGQQYPTRVDTKKQELIQQAMSLMGRGVAGSIREQESQNINPNNGKPYINRYLNAIAPEGYAPGVMPHQNAPAPQQYQQPQYAPAPQQYQQPVPQAPPPPPVPQGPDERTIQIMRQTASKVVAMSIGILPEEQQTPAGMIAACEVWMAYYLNGPLRFGVTAFGEPEHRTSGGNPDGNPADADPREAYLAQHSGNAAMPCPECGYSGGQHASGCPLEFA